MVQLLILSMPLKKVTWTLREEYIDGVPFTMGGDEVRIEAVSPLPIEADSADHAKTDSKEISPKDARKIIPFKKPKEDSKKGA